MNTTPSQTPSFWVYVGSYTLDTGIHLFHLDTASGKLQAHGITVSVVRPNFQAIAPGGKVLYSGVREIAPGDKKIDKIGAFAIDQTSGKLTLLNEQITGGENPCFIAIDKWAKNALTSHYESASVAVLPLDATGRLMPPSSTMHQVGSSIHPKRQTHSYPHSINLDPQSRFVFVPDFGADRIFIYRLDATAGTLTPSDPPSIPVPPGSAPRHMAFGISGKFAYLVWELVSKLIVYAYDASSGHLTEVQTISMLPADYTQPGQAAEVQMHPSGKFLYASNRGHDSIAIFSVDESSGKLTAIGHQSTLGHWPRNFRIDPSGNYLVAANQRADSIVLFHLDPATGMLEPIGSPQTVPQPSCVNFVATA